MLRKKFFVLIIVSMAISVMACGSGSRTKSLQWKLGHNFPQTHPVHIALEQFVKDVESASEGRIKITLFPNAVLGDDTSMIEQLRGDVIQLMKVSTSFVEGFSPLYGVFSIPYLFDSREQFFNVMNSDIVKNIYDSSRPQGFIGLTYYDSGSRSFYTKNKAIMSPADLRGLKIRVIPSPIFVRMIELMGGAATAMPFGEVYTAIQTGTVDGAENNPVALIDMKHGEVAKQFSFDEHSMTPDVIIVNTATWDGLSPEDQQIIQVAADRSTELQVQLWAEMTEKAMITAANMGVTFNYPDKAPFRQAVTSILEEQMQDPAKAAIISAIRATK
ncbi:MAG: TRAP transporter substrate-binding protein [Spirochaetia bacterium]